jgi:hypothetical protein
MVIEAALARLAATAPSKRQSSLGGVRHWRPPHRQSPRVRNARRLAARNVMISDMLGASKQSARGGLIRAGPPALGGVLRLTGLRFHA